MKGRNNDSYDQYTSTINSSYTDQSNQDECIGIDFSTTLKKIQSGFYKLNIGDILEIRLESINVLNAYSDDGQICGNIVSSFNGRIVSCIRKKRDFSAKILNMSGNVQVYNI